MERVKGIEPSAENAKTIDSVGFPQVTHSDYTQIRAQILGELGPELARVVAAWSSLSQPLKAAILAIIDSSAASKEDNR
jgi:hypothetical protein